MHKMNLNDFIWICLTDYGQEEVDNNNLLTDVISFKKIKMIEGKVYHKIQLHEVISTFGNMMWASTKFPIIPTIYLDDDVF